MRVAFYDTKGYDRDYFKAPADLGGLDLVFHDFRLCADNALSADGAEAVCVFVNDKVDRACLEVLAGAGVRLVALRCAGFNNVDFTAAAELGIMVARVPAYSPYAVAEHTVALLLTLNRKIHRAYNRVRELNFSLGGLVGFDLHGKTVGILGTGRIGRITAQIFRGFGCEVIATDPFPDTEWADAHGIRYIDLDGLLSASDVVSLHMPLTPETHHLLCDATIGQMKDGAYLVNTSRGKLVDSTAVISALKSGKLGGVALDVYEEEEGVFFEDHSETALQDDVLARLLTFPNVLVTSHQAFLTREALVAIAETTVECRGPTTLRTMLPCESTKTIRRDDERSLRFLPQRHRGRRGASRLHELFPIRSAGEVTGASGRRSRMRSHLDWVLARSHGQHLGVAAGHRHAQNPAREAEPLLQAPVLDFGRPRRDDASRRHERRRR